MAAISPKGVLDFVRISSVFQKRAADELGVHRASQEKAAAAGHGIADRMVEVGLVAAEKKAAAQAMLGSHAETLKLMGRILEKLAEAHQVMQRQHVDPGRAEAPAVPQVKSGSSRQYAVGDRSDRPRASDDVLRRLR